MHCNKPSGARDGLEALLGTGIPDLKKVQMDQITVVIWIRAARLRLKVF